MISLIRLIREMGVAVATPDSTCFSLVLFLGLLSICLIHFCAEIGGVVKVNTEQMKSKERGGRSGVILWWIEVFPWRLLVWVMEGKREGEMKGGRGEKWRWGWEELGLTVYTVTVWLAHWSPAAVAAIKSKDSSLMDRWTEGLRGWWIFFSNTIHLIIPSWSHFSFDSCW